MIGPDEILRYLPHRYPLLLVDKVVEIEKDKRVVGIKNVTHNEPFFSGHFPDFPIMPGVLILEAMAQTAAVLAIHSLPESARDNLFPIFTGIEKARFRKPVRPGDQLRLEMEYLRKRGDVSHLSGRATVDGELVCQAEVHAIFKRKTDFSPGT